MLGETPTEGWQTFAEGKIKGKEASAAEILEAATIGGWAGGTMSGSARAPYELGQVAAGGKDPSKFEAMQAKTDLVKEAAKTGDV